jgi:hypothetical protein
MDWFNHILNFNKISMEIKYHPNEEIFLEDDYFIIPQIVEKTLIRKLISLAEHFYNPISINQTNIFSSLVLKFIQNFPTLNDKSSNTQVCFFFLSFLLLFTFFSIHCVLCLFLKGGL